VLKVEVEVKADKWSVITASNIQMKQKGHNPTVHDLIGEAR
jgi:hypothetical protein